MSACRGLSADLKRWFTIDTKSHNAAPQTHCCYADASQRSWVFTHTHTHSRPQTSSLHCWEIEPYRSDRNSYKNIVIWEPGASCHILYSNEWLLHCYRAGYGDWSNVESYTGASRHNRSMLLIDTDWRRICLFEKWNAIQTVKQISMCLNGLPVI